MKVLPTTPMTLVMTFWGSDAFGRVFDVLVDNHQIATQILNFTRPDKFFHQEWQIPKRLTKGRADVTVRLQAHTGMMAGGLYGCRTVKAGEFGRP